MYVSAPLKKAGHEVKLLDLMFSKNPLRDLDETIVSYRPDLVSFTIRNLDTQDMLNPSSPLPGIREMVRVAKAREKTTVLGGTAFTTLARPLLKYMEADYGIAGQGETSYLDLALAIASQRSTESVGGLLTNAPEGIRQNPFVPTGYRNSEADWDLVDFRPYKRSIFPAAAIVKTGCPFPCSYCDARTTMGTTPVRREDEVVVEELKKLKSMGLHHVFLIDPSFNVPMARTKVLLERIIRERMGLHLFAPMMPECKNFDAELFELFRRAGGRFIMMGAESFSDTMLRSYRKVFTRDDIRRFVDLANRSGVMVGIEGLFGGPGENRQTILESMEFMKHVEYCLFIYGLGVRILPNTDVYEMALEEGLFRTDDELLFPKFYFSKDVDFEWARRIVKRTTFRYAYRQRRIAFYMAGRMLSRLVS